MKKGTRKGAFLSEERREKSEEKRCAPRGVIMLCAGHLCLRERGKSKRSGKPPLLYENIKLAQTNN